MMKLWTWTAAILLLFGMTVSSEANIANSKHNLSASGPGTIKATSETEICIFCHIPHNAKPEAPLWNRTVTTAAYTMYNSDYLTRAGYTMPSDVGQRSRLCLSCHDGTVAVGSVYTVRGAAGPIAMQGTGYMTSAATGYLGTDLQNDHPVSINYDTGINIVFGTGLRGMELRSPAPPINPKPYTGVKLYGAVAGTSQGLVECTSCHDPHLDTNTKFLVVSNTYGALCTTCHNKTNWSGSIHQSSGQAINNPVGDTQPIPGTTVAEAACMACHKNHSGGGTPYLLRKAASATTHTCYNGTGASTSCHGTGAGVAARNIQTVVASGRKGHIVGSYVGIHTNLDVLYPTGGTPPGSKGLQWSDSKHVECVDCHNPHQALKNTLDSAAVTLPPPLKGATGVRPNSAAAGTARTVFSTLETAAYEYQVCYKCHSYWGLRGIASYTSLSGAAITDQANEFNTNNPSYHWVEGDVGVAKASTTYGDFNTTYVYKMMPRYNNYTNAQLRSVKMRCSDCHGNTDAAPLGPHGSTSNFMLKIPVGSTYTVWNSTVTRTGNVWCFNCHSSAFTNSGFSGESNATHTYSPHAVACQKCHMAVPHGSATLKRLLNPVTFRTGTTGIYSINNINSGAYTKANSHNNVITVGSTCVK
jgi:predicted CXXCH cytochrome family protein